METAYEGVTHALRLLEPPFPWVDEVLRAAEADSLAYVAFPADCWLSISSANAIERLNRDRPPAKVVGIFPTMPSPLCLATAVVHNQHDEWQGDRHLSGQHSMTSCSISTVPRLLTNPLTEGLAA